jgi:putative transcriptional regulator
MDVWRAAVTTLRDLRLRRFQTQKQFADALGVKYQVVQRWENGKSEPRPSSLQKLADVLGISGEELLDAVQQARPRKPAPPAEPLHG